MVPVLTVADAGTVMHTSHPGFAPRPPPREANLRTHHWLSSLFSGGDNWWETHEGRFGVNMERELANGTVSYGTGCQHSSMVENVHHQRTGWPFPSPSVRASAGLCTGNSKAPPLLGAPGPQSFQQPHPDTCHPLARMLVSETHLHDVTASHPLVTLSLDWMYQVCCCILSTSGDKELGFIHDYVRMFEYTLVLVRKLAVYLEKYQPFKECGNPSV